MRLLNTSTLKLEEFPTEEGLQYAILSHRWQAEEVSYNDMQSLKTAEKRKGFAKLRKACQVAESEHYDYIWIDTCCIDKSSSAELSEAINSMFRWYEQAAVCYAYLVDVMTSYAHQEFCDSQWFKRGWTLQELLAPSNVVFYNSFWQKLGTKHNLLYEIQQASGIHENALRGDAMSAFNVAERMSWAADRRTTRPEDIAYSLLGIFEVNMPMLYGEGEKAFLRLQEQIVREHDDRSIFAWKGFRGDVGGLLARIPANFKNSRNLQILPVANEIELLAPSTLTSRGVSIEVRLRPISHKTYMAKLFDAEDGDGKQKEFGIFLRNLREPGVYARVAHNGSQTYFVEPSNYVKGVPLATHRHPMLPPLVTRVVTVRQRWVNALPRSLVPYRPAPFSVHRFYLPFSSASSSEIGIYPEEVDCLGTWEPEVGILGMRSDQLGTAALFWLSHYKPESSGPVVIEWPKLVLLGFDFDFLPVCVIATEMAWQVFQRNHGAFRSGGTEIATDISETAIGDITCFEEKGWSTVNFGVAREVKDHPGLWALKYTSRGESLTYLGGSGWSMSMSLVKLGDGWAWKAALDNNLL